MTRRTASSGRPFDSATSLIVWTGYHAVSLLTGDPVPAGLIDTFFAHHRRALDGVFVLTPQQVDSTLSVSDTLAEWCRLEKKKLVFALGKALIGERSKGVPAQMMDWALTVVGGLQSKSRKSGTPVAQSVTTADYTPVDGAGVHLEGDWVQVRPELAFNVYISFGQAALHFEGLLHYMPGHGTAGETLMLVAEPVITDTFDFHFKHYDAGTGWMDHALARLQCSGDAKPFRIEGRGSSFRLTVTRPHTP